MKVKNITHLSDTLGTDHEAENYSTQQGGYPKENEWNERIVRLGRLSRFLLAAGDFSNCLGVMPFRRPKRIHKILKSKAALQYSCTGKLAMQNVMPHRKRGINFSIYNHIMENFPLEMAGLFACFASAISSSG
jgi:hypothetical protein